MIGSFVSFGLWGTLGLTLTTGTLGLVGGLLVTLVIAMVACGTLNVMIERVAYRPLRGAPKLAPLITAVGFSFILQNVGLLWLGGGQQSVPDLISSQKHLVTFWGITIINGDVLSIAVTAPLVVALVTFISRSRIGKAMRATAQDPEAARLMGINVDTTISFTFLLGGLMAGAAGLIYALYQTTVWFFQGFTAGLIAFTAAVMGGIGNLKGAVLGGLIIGCIQQISDNRIGRPVDAGGRVRLPGDRARVPPAGPAGRGDAGGRMSTAVSSRRLNPLSRLRIDPSRNVKRAITVVVVLAVALLPFAYEAGSGFIDDCTTALIYVVMALGLNIVVGFAGLLDLGYVAFFAIGAYTMGWFGSSFFTSKNIHLGVASILSSLPGIHINFLLILILAMFFTALAGAILGAPTLRLRGDYIAIVTLAFGEIIGRTAVNGDDGVFGIGHFNLTNGRQGITPVDKIDLPVVAQFQTLNLRPWYWTALGLALIAVFINFRLRDSRLGRAWIAVREDEVAAASMGVPLVKTKLYAYATGAACGGWRARSSRPTSTPSTPTSSSSRSRSSCWR